MQNKLTVYLSGQILKGDDYSKCEEWREVAEEIFHEAGWNVLNPIGDRQSYTDCYRDLVVDRDLMMIERCDLVIVNWLPKQDTVGTPMEMVYARMQGTPVIVFGDTPSIAATLDENPWVMRHNSMSHVKAFTIDNLKDIIEWFDGVLPPRYISIGGLNIAKENLRQSSFN